MRHIVRLGDSGNGVSRNRQLADDPCQSSLLRVIKDALRPVAGGALRLGDRSDAGSGLLILARHGESEGNARNIFTGRLDLPLTECGRQEARNIAALLLQSAIEPDIVFTSTLRRAGDTAEIIILALERDIPLIRVAALNERDYGALTGLRKDRAVPGTSADQVWCWRRSFTGRPPGGESLEETGRRVGACYDHAIAPRLATERTVLVVAHGNSLRALVMKLARLAPAQIEDLEIGTGEIMVFPTSCGVAAAEFTRIGPAKQQGVFTL